MTSLACSSLAVNGITVKRFTELIATGEAAHIFAKKLHQTADASSVKDFFDCFKDNKTPKPADPAPAGGQ